jgi:anhydro-N-acetylmuramic acid kinase
MERIRYLLEPWKFVPSSEYGIDPDGKEAMAFAFLAYESWHGNPANLPSATGARRAVPLGKRTRGGSL